MNKTNIGDTSDIRLFLVRWASSRSGVKVSKARNLVKAEPKPIAKDKAQTVRNVLKEVGGEPLP